MWIGSGVRVAVGVHVGGKGVKVEVGDRGVAEELVYDIGGGVLSHLDDGLHSQSNGCAAGRWICQRSCGQGAGKHPQQYQ